MDLKKQLSKARKIDREIWELRIAYSEAKEAAVYQSPGFEESVQNSRGNTSESKAVQAASFKEKIYAKQQELEQAKENIFDLIYNLPDVHSEERTFLLAFYVNRKKASEIADEEYMDVSNVYKKINAAVKLLERYIPK